MTNKDFIDIIKGVKQPSFDNEMIKLLIKGLNDDKSYYSYIQSQNQIGENSGEIDRKEEQNLWRKKQPGFNQSDKFRHMGCTEDINYTFSRLYVNCCKKDLMKIVQLFTDKCIERNLPVYFKYSSDKNKRADQIVIYSNLANLKDYIQILQEIGKQNQDILQRCGQPPLLTGIIDGWIGIGDEPTQKNSSFSGIRAEIIQNTLSEILPKFEDEDGFQSYVDEGIDFNYIRNELRRRFEQAGINLDTFAFNNENLPIYMSDEKTKQDYDCERKKQIKLNEYLKKTRFDEQVSYQKLMLLKQMGVITEEIDEMLMAASARNGLLMDISRKSVNITEEIQRQYGLPTNTRVTEDFRIQYFEDEGWDDVSGTQKQELTSKMLTDITNYYINLFDKEQADIEETLCRYKKLCELPRGQSESIDLDRTDLYTRLKLLANGKAFFESIGIPLDRIELVCGKAEALLQYLEQKAKEKDRSAREERIKLIEREYLYEVLKEIEPSQIECVALEFGIGLSEIIEILKEVRGDFTINQIEIKSDELAN